MATPWDGVPNPRSRSGLIDGHLCAGFRRQGQFGFHVIVPSGRELKPIGKVPLVLWAGSSGTAALKRFTAFGPVPEPSPLALLAVGALGLLGYGWRRRAVKA